jgi:hypothetical protein
MSLCLCLCLCLSFCLSVSVSVCLCLCLCLRLCLCLCLSPTVHLKVGLSFISLQEDRSLISIHVNLVGICLCHFATTLSRLCVMYEHPIAVGTSGATQASDSDTLGAPRRCLHGAFLCGAQRTRSPSDLLASVEGRRADSADHFGPHSRSSRVEQQRPQPAEHAC